jgi:hypothetical protein
MTARRAAAVGDTWHVGVVVGGGDVAAVLDVFGIARRERRFHTGRMAVPGGVTYLVVGVVDDLVPLRQRYAPLVVVVVRGDGGAGRAVVTVSPGGRVLGAAQAFFAAAGEPATLPGFAGGAPFQVVRGAGAGPELSGRQGWAVVRAGAVADAAQTLRYLIAYLPR